MVNDEGLWIKEQLDNSLFIIHANEFDKNMLKSITITETDRYFNNKSTITHQKQILVQKLAIKRCFDFK